MRFKGGSILIHEGSIFEGILLVRRIDGDVLIQDQGGFLFCIDDIKEMILLFQEYLGTFSQEEISEMNKEVYDYHFGNKPRIYQERKSNPKQTEGYIYFLSDNNEYVKIGKAINLDARIESIKLPEKPTLLHSVKVYDYDKAEKIFHDYYAECRKRGEWFSLDAKQKANIQNGYYPDGINELLVGVDNEVE